MTSRLAAAGWLIVILSVGVLGWRLIVKRMPAPPVAESRRLPRLQTSAGAWWSTGAPAPAGALPDLTGVWLGEPLFDISKAALPGQEMVLTSIGKQKYETVDHSKNPTGTCLPPGPVRIML